MEIYKTLKIAGEVPESTVAHLYLNRPSKRNALSLDFFTELPQALAALDRNPAIRVIVLSGAGDHFCAGLDFTSLNSIVTDALSGKTDRGHSGEKLRRQIKQMQHAVTAIERCRKPVVAAVHGGCVGIGVDLIAACDIRYCTKDAFFSVKEVDVAIPADLGALQRLPAIVGYGRTAELALTARRFSGVEAKEMGLVSGFFESKREMDEGVRIVAEGIGSKSPLAVTGTKVVLLRSRELNVEQGLDYVATWNSAMILSQDLTEAVSAQTNKRNPIFSNL